MYTGNLKIFYFQAINFEQKKIDENLLVEMEVVVAKPQ